MRKYASSPFTIILFFAIVTVAFFAPVLFTNSIHLPIGTDFVNFNYPNDLFAAKSLQQGDFPLWNPYLSAGQPFAADPNLGFWYPLRLLLLLTAFSYQTMTYLLIFHYFLAGIFTYALARDMGAGRWGSMAAGVGFMFSGFLVGQMDHINIIFSAIWMPLVFLFFRRAILQQKVAYALAAGLCLALSVLGGHQQYALFTGYWCGLWFIFYVLHVRGRGLLRSASLFGVMAVVAVAATAVQIAPTLEMMQFTSRAVLPINEAGKYSMVPLGWLLLLLPHYLGQTHTEAMPFWQVSVYINEFYPYVGIVVLFGALIGSYVWKSWEKRFLVVMIILGFLLTAGMVIPIYKLAYQIVPGMQWVRVPGRFVFWVDTGLVLLSAFGVDWILSHLTHKDHKLWPDVIKLLGLGALVGLVIRLVYPLLSGWQVSATHPFAAEITHYRLTDSLMLSGIMLGMLLIVLLTRYRPALHTWAPILLLGLLIFDLFHAQQPRHFTTHNMLDHFEHPEIIQLWHNDPGFYRVDFTKAASLGSTDEFEKDLRWNVLTGFVHGFSQTFGLPWNPFDLQRFNDYRSRLDIGGPFYDFLGVKYLVALPGEVLPDQWVRRSVGASSLAVYENSQVLPRAFMVFRSVIEPDPEQALAFIRETSFDPATTVLLEEGELYAGLAGNAQVEITGMTNNRLELMVESDQPGYLVVSDAHYPGWRVLVNGEKSELLRANYIFRAVFLEAGKSSVRFEYHSTAVIWGTAVTLLTWLVVGLVIVYSFRKSIFPAKHPIPVEKHP